MYVLSASNGSPLTWTSDSVQIPGGMVFLRCNTDHHGIALVGGAAKTEATSLNHFAFEVGTLDEVFQAREWLRKHGSPNADDMRRLFQ